MSILPVAVIPAFLLENLPLLPNIVRYYDDFADIYRSIKNIASEDTWEITDDGLTSSLDFSRFDHDVRIILKNIVLDFISRLDITSVKGRFGELYRSEETSDFIRRSALLLPHEMRAEWITRILPNATPFAAEAMRAVLRSMCNLSIGHWNSHLSDYVSQLPGPKHDPYKVVRTGECFVPLDQQSLVTDHFDGLVARMSTDAPSTEELRDACILIIVFQYAFRPGQVSRIKIADLRVFETGAVHFAAIMTKKRDPNQRRLVNRSVKRDWCPLFVEYRRRRGYIIDLGNGIPANSLFGLTPADVSHSISRTIKRITGEAWTPTDLRHTAAQRQADSGASHMSVSEFLGHSNVRTANVYFDASPTQAQRVNNALGLSPIYSAVADVHRTKTIDKKSLMALPEDNQIGGVPHGVPIAGIGGCEVGQSGCTKNPVVSCYGCRKFLPVNDVAMHRQVTEGLRPVVHEFAAASRVDPSTPAYTQLRHTLEEAERVIADIEAGNSPE